MSVRREIKLETFLANLPLFRGLAKEELATIAAGTRRRKLARGESLFHEGDPSNGLFAVVYGKIQLTARGRTVDIVGPGKSFGEAIMFLEKPYIVTATAAADSLVLQVQREVVFAELERSPLFARRIIASLSQRVETMVRELDSYALGNAGQRFVAWLLRAEGGGSAGELVVTLPAAKAAIASRLNLSAEHLSRVLKELSKQGLLEVHGRVLRIPDVARLRASLS
jgi:CRP/FNR family transcriptional regulator, dissimilatory nitrate respiration regulator